LSVLWVAYATHSTRKPAAAPLNTCTTIEQRGVVRFLWENNIDAAKDIHKEMLPIWAAFLCGNPLLHPYFFTTKKRTPRCSIVVHVFKCAANL
jgi:hypothetical protein